MRQFAIFSYNFRVKMFTFILLLCLIWFLTRIKRPASVSNAMATLEELNDLCTCCVCFNQYDRDEHKPKYLITCLHTICVCCIQVSSIKLLTYVSNIVTHTILFLIQKLKRLTLTSVACPKCRKVCELPEGSAHNLPNNDYAIPLIGERQRK